MTCPLSGSEQEIARVLTAQTREWNVDLFHNGQRLFFVISAPDWCSAIADAIQSAGLCHEHARRVTFDVREV